ncbi:MAG: adenine deaminase [Planctomycetota bacterium]
MSVSELVANVVDLEMRSIHPSKVVVESGRIVAIHASDQPCSTFLLPGFVDAHVHIESSMLTPGHFAQAAVVYGTVATVSDPHEIANVLGVPGVRFMLDDAEGIPFKFAFGAPSCVPATVFETAGAALSVEDVTWLLDEPTIYYLSEVMDFPGVLAGSPKLLAMIAAAKERGKPVDGHAPGLRGDHAQQYRDAGITTDHECFTLEEAEDKLKAGMLIQIREGSAAKNFEALWPLIDRYPGRVMLCSDDKHPDELIKSHIDELVRRAIAKGCDLYNVLTAACQVPVQHYSLPVGQLKVGDPADFIEVDSLSGFGVLRSFIDGQLVAEQGRSLIQATPAEPINCFECTHQSPQAFAVPCRLGANLRVICAIDGQLITDELEMEPTLSSGLAVADPSRDLLKLVAVNRYDVDAEPAVAFVKGFGLKRGAIAGSVGHDSHNILAVGTNDQDLADAINSVIEHRGGLAVADEGRIKTLALEVGGLMSIRPCDEVATDYEALCEMTDELGTTLGSAFMTLSFMGLLVIPQLKLSDQGLFDFKQFGFVDIWV